MNVVRLNSDGVRPCGHAFQQEGHQCRLCAGATVSKAAAKRRASRCQFGGTCMPTSSTLAPGFAQIAREGERLSWCFCMGSPRSASLPPVRSPPRRALCLFSSAGSERPPEEVSPLMLALTTEALILPVAKALFQQGHPARATAKPYWRSTNRPAPGWWRCRPWQRPAPCPGKAPRALAARLRIK